MKNLLLIFVTFVAASLICNDSIAQYAIPSYNVVIVAEPTTFEESSNNANVFSKINHRKPIFIQIQNSDEERKMHVKLTSTDGQRANAAVLIYSLDEEEVLGPFYLTDESVLEQTIDNREWGVEVVSASENCKLSTWIE